MIEGVASGRAVIRALDLSDSLIRKLGLPESGINQSSFSRSNNKRDWRFFGELFQRLAKDNLSQLSKYQLPRPFCHIFDGTFFRVGSKRFDWAPFNSVINAIKVTFQYNNTGLPTDIRITRGKDSDVKCAQKFDFLKDALYIYDAGYKAIDIYRKIIKSKAFFIFRHTRQHTFKHILMEFHVPSGSDIIRDLLILWGDENPIKVRVIMKKMDNGEPLFLYTNLLEQDAFHITELYRLRWKIEVFFRWIKGNFPIKHFYGTTENAVAVQIFVALIAYLLIWIMNKKTGKTMLALRELFRHNHSLLETLIDVNPPPLLY